MNVRLTQLDGPLPNLALMKLAHWHKSRGDDVTLTRSIQPLLWESQYDKVYGSAIFRFSDQKIEQLWCRRDMRITKKRLQALNFALSMDDVLYEKFRRLNDDLQKREREFARRKQVVRVYLREHVRGKSRESRIFRALQIEDIQHDPEGVTVICR
jgi:hypothetical protein